MTKPDKFCLFFQLFLPKCVPWTLKTLSFDLRKKLGVPWNTLFIASLGDCLAIFEVGIEPPRDHTFTAGPDLMCPIENHPTFLIPFSLVLLRLTTEWCQNEKKHHSAVISKGTITERKPLHFCIPTSFHSFCHHFKLRRAENDQKRHPRLIPLAQPNLTSGCKRNLQTLGQAPAGPKGRIEIEVKW